MTRSATCSRRRFSRLVTQLWSHSSRTLSPLLSFATVAASPSRSVQALDRLLRVAVSRQAVSM